MKSRSRRSSLLTADLSRRCLSTKKPRPIRRTPPMQDMKQAAFTFSFRTTGRQSTCIAPLRRTSKGQTGKKTPNIRSRCLIGEWRIITIPRRPFWITSASTGRPETKKLPSAIWWKLALDEFSYYGQRAAEKLGRTQSGRLALTSTAACLPAESLTVAVQADLANLRHPVRSEMSHSSDVVSELVFLRLWDEAAFWMERPGGARIPPRAAAQIAYLAGRYNRSIFYADRLPKTESTLPLLYPAGYRQTICNAAMAQNVDPAWLHAIIWQESKYNPNARSGAAARGLMQFIPETAQAVAASAGMSEVTPDKLYDPAISIQLGAKYWSTLLGQLNSPEMALAAYNGGADNVEKWRSKASDPELFVADIGFAETKKYVLAVFAERAAYASLLK